MPLNAKTRLFLILLLLGLVAVPSLLLIDVSAVITLLPAGTEVPPITPVIKILTLVQPTLLLAVAVLIGVVVAHRVGLASPFAESLAAGAPTVSALTPQLLPGVLGAFAGGATLLLSAALFRPLMTAETVDRIARYGSLLPLPTRVLYGGIAEELLIRWGLMSLIVWAAWRLFQKHLTKPTAGVFIAAILISSLVFAVGHLPVAVALGETSAAVILFVIVGNTSFGLVAGYLYWKYGLESAIIAHMLGHLVLAAASYAGAYF